MTRNQNTGKNISVSTEYYQAKMLTKHIPEGCMKPLHCKSEINEIYCLKNVPKTLIPLTSMSPSLVISKTCKHSKM